MPKWLCNQMMRAFYKKDRRQVKLLNECWFFYRNHRDGNHNAESM